MFPSRHVRAIRFQRSKDRLDDGFEVLMDMEWHGSHLDDVLCAYLMVVRLGNEIKTDRNRSYNSEHGLCDPRRSACSMHG